MGTQRVHGSSSGIIIAPCVAHIGAAVVRYCSLVHFGVTVRSWSADNRASGVERSPQTSRRARHQTPDQAQY